MAYRTFTAPVAGGELFVGAWETNPSAPIVLAVHGITANHLTWAYVAEALGDDARVIAPDLRGRAGSAALPGPYGMAAHADDLAALLDHLGVERATLAGHSMGAYVSAMFAKRHHDRLAGHVLVDGGVSLDMPQDLDIDVVLNTVLGPTMQRLSMTFADEGAWLDFWKAHPALQDWNEAIEAYVMHDLGGTAPELRSRTSIDAVRADGADTLQGDGGFAFRDLKEPTPWLRAPRGLLNQTPGLYSDETAAALTAAHPMLVDQLVDDVNHFTITIDRPGAAVVADAIRSQLPG